VRLIAGRLVAVWYDWKIGTPGKVHVWDVEKGKLLRTVGKSWSRSLDLRISGDGSKVFLLDHQSIRAWSLSTGEAVGDLRVDIKERRSSRSLIVSGSRVWLSGPNTMGWDFGNSDSLPIALTGVSPDRQACFDFLGRTIQNQTGSLWIEDAALGRLVLRLPERFASLSARPRWDKHFLVFGHHSGEVSILDFKSCIA